VLQRSKWYNKLNGNNNFPRRFFITHFCGNPLNYIFIHSFIHSSMALQPFVGPWPLLQFRNLFYTVGRTSWTGDQPVARQLPTHRVTQTQNKRTQTSMPLSGIRTHDPSVRAGEDSSCLRKRGHCDRLNYVYTLSNLWIFCADTVWL
jgi:hypothetical protein